MKRRNQRILHMDGDSYFASCEIALDPKLKNRPVFVGGGRRGDGMVIAANYIAKKYGIKTGMACFEAKRLCPMGVLTKPHYDEYRRLSLEMFKRIRQYTPMLVPTSIDEGFLDFTDSPSVFRFQNPTELVTKIRREIAEEVGIPVSAGLASSRLLAKLATESSKPDGFCEVPEVEEREFLRDMPVEKIVGIGERRARSLRVLMVFTLGDIAALPHEIMRKRFGVLGTELWLLATGQLRERLNQSHKHRTCISSSTTLPYDEPDYEAALLFLLDQTERVITTFIRENLKAHEMSVYIRFKNLDGDGFGVRFPGAQFEPSIINPVVEQIFWRLVSGQTQPIRQVCISFNDMEPLNLEPDLFGFNKDYTRRELHHALEKIEDQYGKGSVKTGTRLLLETEAKHLVAEKSKCPFIPQREMQVKMNRIAEPNADPVYEEEWLPLEFKEPDLPPEMPRNWGRSTTRPSKFG